MAKRVNHAPVKTRRQLSTAPFAATKNNEPNERDTAGPLGRYMSVLELVAAFPEALTLSDVSSLLELPKTSAHRLLGGLVRAGLITGGGHNRTFKLGDRLVRLLHASAEDSWIATLVRPVLHALVEETGETCYLTRLVGHRVLVAVSESPEVRWRSYVQPNLEMPPHAAATAKAILAFQDRNTIERALRGTLPRFTANTCRDAAKIKREYGRVRDLGYATCIGEIDEGLAALGVPVKHADGGIFYAVGMTGPLQRIMQEPITGRLASLEAAAKKLANVLSLGSAIATRHRGNSDRASQR